jgi:hypothetical protein
VLPEKHEGSEGNAKGEPPKAEPAWPHETCTEHVEGKWIDRYGAGRPVQGEGVDLLHARGKWFDVEAKNTKAGRITRELG